MSHNVQFDNVQIKLQMSQHGVFFIPLRGTKTAKGHELL